ncbi:MAG: GNAT family N-acetyltransferase [Xenococcaceae cyanobacterium MO_234.B1]|nr:GNAT family N-acetyltransferase [Xenococcaceae cyanobacterium MO_234.B1]
MSSTLPLGYSLRYCGEGIISTGDHKVALRDRKATLRDHKVALRDRQLLTRFMELTYQELFPNQSNFNHLAVTVNQYLSQDTPLWWVENSVSETVACLWMGNAIDQVNGERYSHIFLLFVHPQHRRCGIGTSLINLAEAWARRKGDRQMGIQVFADNQPALHLYRKMGFQTQSLLMLKSLDLPSSSDKKMPEL